MGRRRGAALVVLALAATITAGGCSNDDDPPKTTRTDASEVAATDDDEQTEAPAPPASTPKGQLVGGAARQFVLADNAYGKDMPTDVSGVAVGAKRGDCVNVDPTTEYQGLAQAAGEDMQLSTEQVLVASCGSTGWSIMLWKRGTALVMSEFTRGKDGLWKETEGEHYPPCGVPDDVLELWRFVDDVDCSTPA
ncbi:MAG: hypothetical protein JWL76_703 [Thermoleophilia bacterium]|nr:hypothetical protein [Thermoleophilia bacterium]